MQGAAWIGLLQQIPQSLHDTLLLMTTTGFEIVLQIAQADQIANPCQVVVFSPVSAGCHLQEPADNPPAQSGRGVLLRP